MNRKVAYISIRSFVATPKLSLRARLVAYWTLPRSLRRSRLPLARLYSYNVSSFGPRTHAAKPLRANVWLSALSRGMHPRVLPHQEILFLGCQAT